MLSGNMLIRAFELQKYRATKILFRAVAEGKSVIIYGPSGSGKTTLINENERLLGNYSYMYVNIKSKTNLKKLIEQQGLIVAEGIYDGRRELNLPRDNIVEIHLGITLGKRTNELSYE